MDWLDWWLLWFVEGEKRRERDRKKEADVMN